MHSRMHVSNGRLWKVCEGLCSDTDPAEMQFTARGVGSEKLVRVQFCTRCQRSLVQVQALSSDRAARRGLFQVQDSGSVKFKSQRAEP